MNILIVLIMHALHCIDSGYKAVLYIRYIKHCVCSVWTCLSGKTTLTKTVKIWHNECTGYIYCVCGSLTGGADIFPVST